ncbi:MAG TPA: metal-dependent hydrolase [Flavobacteriaceae bacterium]|jgi:inner membrane protein
MASIFGHSMVGYTISRMAAKSNMKALVILAIVSSNLPDIDVLAFHFGIPYEAPFGHRGFTHSIFFALIWALVVMLVFGKTHKKLYALVIFFSTMSHGILDAMTTGGRGVGFFIPFDDTRHFLPWRVIKVSPLSVGQFFSEWGLQVILNEFIYIFIPCIVVLIFVGAKNSKKEI